MMKINIGVIFGGKSVEHEISIITAIQAMNNIDKDKYEVIPIYITKDLQWYTGGCLKFIDTFKDFDLIKRYAKRVNLINSNGRFILQTCGFIKKELFELHLAFPMVHGANIEDGSIQGYLNMVGIPYVGSNTYSSAIAQDKVFTHQLLQAVGLPVTKFVWFGERFYRNKKEELFKQIDELKYPLIIKPATLGSSIGIEKIDRKEELDSTIERVFKYDSKLIIEEAILDVTEYNCSVLLTDKGNITSDIEEIVSTKGIREYEDKYIDENEFKIIKGENQALLSISDSLILASGTVALEAALYQTPMIIGYKGPWILYLIYLLVRCIKNVSLPNIITGENIVEIENKNSEINLKSINNLINTALLKVQGSLNEIIIAYTNTAKKVKKDDNIKIEFNKTYFKSIVDLTPSFYEENEGKMDKIAYWIYDKVTNEDNLIPNSTLQKQLYSYSHIVPHLYTTYTSTQQSSFSYYLAFDGTDLFISFPLSYDYETE